ncbi:substrate-binding domain-containing protein [Dysgonomonas sp. GY617]|uniref:substrate-binding domain-containing protein n=1 Tax=Dysgonomonas sp. GY617 TaxID=2780420 RepID=UPI0018833E6E|nr:substrate-binding domain-containing protein [Dysgonomonas sp. GY617]MBF0575015.1 substrate-binding domain-containing protein [Dysgonomonas sp. GY617]
MKNIVSSIKYLLLHLKTITTSGYFFTKVIKRSETLLVICILLSIIQTACRLDKKSQYVVGVSQCSDDLWRETVNGEILREASFFQNMQVQIKTVKDDTQQQIKDIESFIDAGVDLLVVSPNESTAITPIIQKAYRSGIPVILLDRKIDTDDYTAYVGADNYQLAYELGLYVSDVLKEKGNVVVMRGWKGSTADAERYKGFMDAIGKYPSIKIIAEKRGDFLKNVAEQQMEEVFKNHESIDLVFAMNDPMALGVHNAAMKYSGKSPFIVGIDALSGEGGGIESIQKGLIDASFIYPTGGDKVIDIANRILNKESFDKENILYTAVVDKSNVRVLQLQTNQIFEHQFKFDKMNRLLDKSLLQYSNQRTLFYISLIALCLITLLLFLAYKAYKAKSRANTQLEKQNEEIKRQAEILTEQKEQLISLSKQLEEATHAKLVFFTNISHEFKTPLSLILGPVEALLATDKLTTDQRELLTLVKRNSNRLLHLISEIIEFRSYENGKMKTNFSHNDLSIFLNDLTPLFYDSIKRKQIQLLVEADDSDFLMWFDKEKVEKIYFNLLSNALKHSNAGGRIVITLRKEIISDVEYAKLSVFNSGSFIAQEELHNIFDRFYKLDSRDGSTGIGLALTSTLVDIHRGKIYVESKDGEGTTFYVLLPFSQEHDYSDNNQISYEKGYTEARLELDSMVVDEEVLPENNSKEDKPLVLIIEDNADMRSFMYHILNQEYTVIEAEDGAEGLKKAKKYIPDLIISDVMMPEKDGFEVCHYLKENISTSHIPVILLTACSLDEQKVIGFESGADAYIPKPFNANLLNIRVRKLIENRQKMKEAFGNSLINDSKKTSLAESEQNFIDSFRDYVESHISDSELNLDDVAKSIGLSKSQLYRKIKSLTNYSPNELIRIIRLKYAKHLLNSKDKTISEVAYEAGFSSPSYFTKCFKEFYNESPTSYIERISK